MSRFYTCIPICMCFTGHVMAVRLLVAGSLLGEVLIYSVEEDGSFLTLHHVQTLPGCCGAPVTCTAWSTDCRYAMCTSIVQENKANNRQQLEICLDEGCY